MSYDYSNGLDGILELNVFKITVNTQYQDEFPDYRTLSNHKYLVIRDWNKPLPELPSSIIAISFMNDCNHSLNNLPSTVEAIEFHRNVNVPLDNLPQNLIYLGFLSLYFTCYKFPLNNLPESLQILIVDISMAFEDYSNLPAGLKLLNIKQVSKCIGHYPAGLECLDLSSLRMYDESIVNTTITNLHLELLPITIKKLYLPVLFNYEYADIYPNLDSIISRLINLEELSLSGWLNVIDKKLFSNKLNTIFIDCNYDMLEQIPNSVKTLYISDNKDYLQSKNSNLEINFASIVNTNISHINLGISETDLYFIDLCIDILAFIPNHLKELTVLETHPALSQFAIKYPNVKINKLPNYDYQEKLVDDMRGYPYW